MPFDEEDEEEVVAKVGVKLKNSKSMFANKPKKPSKEDFEKAASEANNKLNSHNERAMELSLAFKKILEDKTLAENKNVFASEVEMEVIGGLVELGINMNTDENETEGMGSIGLITLLLRCMLIQRDKINASDFKVFTQGNAIKTLEKKIEELSKAAPALDTKKDSE
jgi:hypothetical protein